MLLTAAASVPKLPSQSGGYAVGRPRGTCAATARTIEPGEAYVGALTETDAGIGRLDFAADAWNALTVDEQGAHLAWWRGTMPRPDEDSNAVKLAVDDDLLLELFRRLDRDDAPADRLAFRFVTGLMLMRHKRLTFVAAEVDDAGRDLWRLRVRGGDGEMLSMLDPKLAEPELQIAGAQMTEMLTTGLDAAAFESDAEGE